MKKSLVPEEKVNGTRDYFSVLKDVGVYQ